jgi:branched-chain amino acid transport system ATP-binding protein|tara:strand:- start:929 stop:1567 length:639 start_codon:yes stop_codon:yes gene_type:complete
MLKINKLNVDIGLIQILKNVSLDLEKGQMVGLIGRNGAGKTTLLRAIMGILKTKSGELIFEENDLIKLPAQKRAYLSIGYMPEDRKLIPSMTAEENILTPAWATGIKDWESRLKWIYKIIPEALELKDRPSTSLSGGQQKLIALSRALMVGSKLLLLDEPSEGIAPALTKRIIDILNNLKKEGVTTLIAESNAGHYKGMLEKSFIIERGEIK